MKVVSPYRPFAPESAAHLRLGPFDWVDALRMLRASVSKACGCETFVITDVDTDLPVPSHQYVTTHRRLMLWILEVSLRYLESDDFDQDTVMISPDTLVSGDLARWFAGADLGVMARLAPKYASRPLLNGVQFWGKDGQARLIAFYRQALARALTLPEGLIRWGADTEPLVYFLQPFESGLCVRSGLRVHVIDARLLKNTVTDFKGWRKHGMAVAFRSTTYPAVAAC